MLRDRLVFGPIFIALLIGVIWGDESIARSAGVQVALVFPSVLIVSMLAGYELAMMARARGVAVSRILTLASVALGVTVSSFTPADLGAVSGVAVACTCAGLVLFVSMGFAARHKTADGVFAASGATLFAFVYTGLTSGFFVVIAKDFSGWALLGVLLVTKSCDIGAFFTGTAIGRHKLIEWLSPGKTWEGLVGGAVFSTGVGAALAAFSEHASLDLTIAQGAALGLVFGLVGQAGDLMASLVKRDMGQKDASSTLPGFGGVLDVLDSPLLVAPVAYWMLGAVA